MAFLLMVFFFNDESLNCFFKNINVLFYYDIISAYIDYITRIWTKLI